MTASIDFSDCWSKIKGAERQIDLLRKLTSPLDQSFYEVVVEKTYGPVIYLNPRTHYQLAYRPKEKISDALANVIGASFVNLRSALDYAAKRIVLGRIPGTPADATFHFPAAPRKDLPSHKGIRAIEQAVPGFKKLLLKEIRPENGPNEALWDFAAIANDDKHADFVPTITVVEIVTFDLKIGTNTFKRFQVGSDAERPCVLIESEIPFSVNNDFQVAVDIAFGRGTMFENQPVLPTMFQIRDIVSEALKAVEEITNRP